MRKILFVDDEKNVLSGLRRMMRPLRETWESHFALSGPEALEVMKDQHFDVVVSDMRMPGMDGESLLNEVMQLYPDTVRILLSGSTEDECLIRCACTAHQFLPKPCESEMLTGTVEYTCALGSMLKNEKLRTITSRLASLPTLPSLYTDLMNELKSDSPSVKKVANTISSDAMMTAKILQMANSAYFGFQKKISDPEQALSVLGLKMVGALILTAHVFSQHDNKNPNIKFIESVINHSLLTAIKTRKLVETETTNREAASDAFVAGLLHDVGKVVLASNLPEEYAKVIETAYNQGIPTHIAEERAFGCSHCDVGSYLLGLWALPNFVVEACAYHHNPDECTNTNLSTLSYVHVCNSFSHEEDKSCVTDPKEKLNEDYLEKIDVSDKIERWKYKCNDNKGGTRKIA